MAVGTESRTRRSRSPRTVTTLLCRSLPPAAARATRHVRHAADPPPSRAPRVRLQAADSRKLEGSAGGSPYYRSSSEDREANELFNQVPELPSRRRHPASTGQHGGSGSDSTPFMPASTAPAAGGEQGQALVLAGQPVGGVGRGITPRGSIGRNRDRGSRACERGRIRRQGQGRRFPSACHAGQLTWSATQ